MEVETILDDASVLTLWGRVPLGEGCCQWCGGVINASVPLVRLGVCQECFERETGIGGE